MTLAEPLAVTLRVARALEQLGVRYLIGGSLASSVHGLPRTTNDADVLGVFHVQGRALDFEYMRKWAPHLGIVDLLDRALGEASLP